MSVYYVALAEAECLGGGWCIVEEFEASDNRSANRYAEEYHSDLEWYVLDENKCNINS